MGKHDYIVQIAFLFVVLDFDITGALKYPTKCYEGLGCYSAGPPFFHITKRPISVLPQSPTELSTTFLAYTREFKDTPLAIPDQVSQDALGAQVGAKPVKIIIHGYNESVNNSPWIKDLKTELLKHGDYLVIVVEWSRGALPLYPQAVANARVVGAQTAQLIKALVASGKFTPADFHIIGHSLGAHVAGYAGDMVPNLGRISGLDPAGPFFTGTDREVRLDESDADFVDVIHTNAGNLINLGFGSTDTSGHVSFYPNGGRQQPGCRFDLLNSVFDDNVRYCSHRRSTLYFTESINSACQFTAYPCDSYEDFNNGLCRSCDKGGCSVMGFHAAKHKPPKGQLLKYYLTTATEAPYCR